MTKKEQRDFMEFMECKNRLSEDLANNYINLIELNNKEVNEKTIIKVLDDLLLELVQEFINLLSDNYDLEFDDFLINKIEEKQKAKLFNVIVIEKATNEMMKFENVQSIDKPFIDNDDVIEITHYGKYYTSIFDKKHFEIYKSVK